MSDLLNDIRLGARVLRRSPRLAIGAGISIALGIGAATFILTLGRSVLGAALPFPDADRLARVWLVERGAPDANLDVSYPEAREIARQARSFDALAVAARTRLALRTDEGTERVRGESVNAEYFPLIGMRPALGRGFEAPDFEPDAPLVVLLSHDTWQRRYQGDPDVVGRTAYLRGSTGGAERAHTIIGVMPEGFIGTVDPDVSELWLPLEQYMPRRLLDSMHGRFVWTIARLAPGVTIADAEREVALLQTRLAAGNPGEYDELSFRVEPMGESFRSRLRAGLVLLSVAAGLLLLIACTNTANLLLARLAEREHEVTVRKALGARAGRIVSQLFAESLAIATLGGVAGALLASFTLELVARWQLLQLPPYVTLRPDLTVLAIASALVLATATIFGALPAWRGARTAAAGVLHGGRSGLSRRQHRVLDSMAVAQITLAFVLLAGAALLVRSYGNLVGTDPGYRTERLLRMALSLDRNVYSEPAEWTRFAEDVRAAFRTESGVEDVSVLAGVLPPWFDEEVGIIVAGEPIEGLGAVQRHAADAAFLDVLDIPVLRGRGITDADRADTRLVAVLSESLARAMFGDAEGAIGRTFRIDAADPVAAPLEVVGIASDVSYHGPLQDRTSNFDLYVPISQHPGPVLSIAIATHGDAAALLPRLQRELGRMAPTSPQHWMSTMRHELQLQFRDARLYAFLMTCFGVTALVLVAFGLFTLLHNTVAQRRVEFAVRAALGARPGDIARLVLRHGVLLTAVGVVTGGFLAWNGGRMLESLLFGLEPGDATTLVAVAAGVVACALAAAAAPAVQAARTDLIRLLRGE